MSKHNSKSRTAFFSFLVAVTIVALGIVVLYFGHNLQPKVPTGPVALPDHLIIPSIKVNALIQYVGTDAAGRMGLPTNFTDVAWYKYGPKPGDPGSAVIAGHLDTVVSNIAVFMDLAKLKPGDDVYIQDKNGQKIHFKVTDKELYDDAKAPVAKIFDQTGTTARLNLITCDGVWNEAARNYSQRLIIYTERVQ